MAQLDDDIGIVMKKLKDIGEDENTIVVFTTDNGTEVFTWPDGGHDAVRAVQGDGHGRRLPRAVHRPLARPHPGGHGAERHHVRAWTGSRRSSPPPATRTSPSELLKGVKIGDRTYKNHLDGYDQTAMLTGKGPSDASRDLLPRREHRRRGPHRRLQVPLHRPARTAGWARRPTSDVPYITNLRLDPFERMGWPNNGTKEGGQQYFDWFKYQFWRFVFVQQVMGKELQTFLEYPPMQRGASFNLDAVKAEMAKRMAQAEAASKGPGQ